MLIIVGLSLITPKQKSELARFYGSGGDTYFIEYVHLILILKLIPAWTSSETNRSTAPENGRLRVD